MSAMFNSRVPTGRPTNSNFLPGGNTTSCFSCTRKPDSRCAAPPPPPSSPVPPLAPPAAEEQEEEQVSVWRTSHYQCCVRVTVYGADDVTAMMSQSAGQHCLGDTLEPNEASSQQLIFRLMDLLIY